MLFRQRSMRQTIPFIFSFLFIFIFISLKSSKYFQCPSCPILSTSTTRYTSLDNTEDKQTLVDDLSIYCLEMGSRFDKEQYLPQSPIIYAPSLNSIRLHRLPYRYSQWKSSPLLGRRLTSCEHTLVMRLLMIIERICRKHNITFLMSEGTLLGSWRHHDIIPWDDDVDIMMPLAEKSRFTDALNQMNKTLISYYILINRAETNQYYKLFFKHTSSAGEFSWNFPFIDIFFYVTNKTHLWEMGKSGSAMKIKYYFPLVMRPLGELWLPAPSKPQQILKFDPFDECRGHFWDHRNEVGQEEISVQCDDLKNIYPFVQRYKQNKSTEILRTIDTIIHTIIY